MWLSDGYEEFEELVGLIQLTDTTTNTILCANQDGLLQIEMVLDLPLETADMVLYMFRDIFMEFQ